VTEPEGVLPSVLVGVLADDLPDASEVPPADEPDALGGPAQDASHTAADHASISVDIQAPRTTESVGPLDPVRPDGIACVAGASGASLRAARVRVGPPTSRLPVGPRRLT